VKGLSFARTETPELLSFFFPPPFCPPHLVPILDGTANSPFLSFLGKFPLLSERPLFFFPFLSPQPSVPLRPHLFPASPLLFFKGCFFLPEGFFERPFPAPPSLYPAIFVCEAALLSPHPMNFFSFSLTGGRFPFAGVSTGSPPLSPPPFFFFFQALPFPLSSKRLNIFFRVLLASFNTLSFRLFHWQAVFLDTFSP